MQLSNEVAVTAVIDATAGAAGATDLTSDIIDMANFRGCMFIITVGAVVATAVTAVKVQQGAAANMSDAADLTGTNVTIADDDDDTVIVLDIYRPIERYLRLYVDRATANATLTANAIQYEARKRPASHGATVTAELHVSPAEGTA